MGTRFSWAYLIRCDANNYICQSLPKRQTSKEDQSESTPTPFVRIAKVCVAAYTDRILQLSP